MRRRLPAALLLLGACDLRPPDPQPEGETGGYTGETGVSQMAFAGAALVEDGAFVEGWFGSIVVDGDEDWRCDATGPWSEVDGETTCPECDWSFTLRVDDSRAAGDLCDAFGMNGGYWDGFVGDWGFASSWDYYGEPLEDVVLYHSGDTWFPFVYLGSAYGWVDADDRGIVFVRYTGYYYDYEGR